MGTRRVQTVVLGTVGLLAACVALPVDVSAETPAPACGAPNGAIRVGSPYDQCEFVADGSRPSVVGSYVAVEQRFILDRPYVVPEQVHMDVRIVRRSTDGSFIEVVRCDGHGLSAASCAATSDTPVEAGTILTCMAGFSDRYSSTQQRAYACSNS